MESFKQFNKQPTITQSRGHFEQQLRSSNQHITTNFNKYQISAYQQKTSFLRYASSLLQIATQEQQKNQQIPVYEQSELINPPQSLIQKYQTLRKQRPSYGNISCQSIPRNSHSKTKKQNGITKLALILQNKLNNYLSTNQQPKSLIDLLTLNSTQNLNLINEKNVLKQAFHKIKYFAYYRSYQKPKLIKPVVPLNKKKLHQQQNKFNIILKQLNIQKKQGAQQLAGILTFKILIIQSQSFKVIKNVILEQKINKIINSIRNLIFKKVLNSLFQFSVLKSSKLDSKILTLSKSKSKLSSSKLRSYQVNSQKRLSIKKQNFLQDQKLNGDEYHNEHVISSEILQNFDFTQFKSKIDEEDILQSDRKNTFNNRLIKKNSKDSISQAQTINSKRSFQSQYQFPQGVSSKISTCKKPISVRNFEQEDDQIPTQKIIKRKKSPQKIYFQNNLLNHNISPSNSLKQFKKEERRYLNVRTNLFELPLQLQLKNFNSKSNYKKCQMSRIYHLMPDGLMKNQGSQDQKDSLIMNLNKIIIPNTLKHTQSEKKIGNYETFIQKQQKKKRKKHPKDVDRMEMHYLNLQNEKNQKNFQIHTKITNNTQIVKDNKNNGNALKGIQPNQSKLNKHKSAQNLFSESSQYEEQQKNNKKQIKPSKLKTKINDNLEEYYFKTELKKYQKQKFNQNQTQRQSNSNKKLLKQINGKQFETPNSLKINHIQTSKQFYETQYRTSKIHSGVNSTNAIKSSSPKVKLALRSPYRTGKLGSRLNQNSPMQNNRMVNIQQKNGVITISKTPSKIFSSSGGSGIKMINQLPIQPESSGMRTPKNIHQFVSTGNPTILLASRGKSKLKIYSQSPRSLSPQQNTVKQHLFPSQHSNRKGLIMNNNISPQKIIQIASSPSNNIFISAEGSIFTPTNSNLSNQSNFTNNVHKVINYAPNIGFNQQMSNRPSSILSTHSNQSKEKIIITKSSQHLMSPTQRQMHMMMAPPNLTTPNTILSNGSMSPRNKNIQDQINNGVAINNMKRGLNVMSGNPLMNVQKPCSNTNLQKMNSVIRPKSISNQKISLTIRK